MYIPMSQCFYSPIETLATRKRQPGRCGPTLTRQHCHKVKYKSLIKYWTVPFGWVKVDNTLIIHYTFFLHIPQQNNVMTWVLLASCFRLPDQETKLVTLSRQLLHSVPGLQELHPVIKSNRLATLWDWIISDIQSSIHLQMMGPRFRSWKKS